MKLGTEGLGNYPSETTMGQSRVNPDVLTPPAQLSPGPPALPRTCAEKEEGQDSRGRGGKWRLGLLER